MSFLKALIPVSVMLFQLVILLTGKAYPHFQKILITKRQNSLPNWLTTSRFNHLYRLSVNTGLFKTKANTTLEVGNNIEILSPSN
jgi:uncharacterized protein